MAPSAQTTRQQSLKQASANGRSSSAPRPVRRTTAAMRKKVASRGSAEASEK